jgi:hypothetical protein
LKDTEKNENYRKEFEEKSMDDAEIQSDQGQNREGVFLNLMRDYK